MRRIQVRMRAMPTRLVIESPKQEVGQKSLIDILRDWLTVIVGATGIFTVLLYLTGRYYAGGYFSAMNIPDYQVSFSQWEYGEVGWLILICYPVITMIFGVLLAGVVKLLGDLLRPKLSRWLDNRERNNPEISSKEWKRWFKILGNSFIGLFTIGFLIGLLGTATKFGAYNGTKAVLENASQVELISTAIIPLDDPNLIKLDRSAESIYIYRGFHLLTSNNGKYYLYREINPLTCKPYKVYIVEARENIQVNLLRPISLTYQCKQK